MGMPTVPDRHVSQADPDIPPQPHVCPNSLIKQTPNGLRPSTCRRDTDHCRHPRQVPAVGGDVVLWWTDCIAYEWSETYPDLATALARLAVLHPCIVNNEGFEHPDPHEFIRAATPFLDSSTTMPAAQSPTRSAWQRVTMRH